MKITVNQWHIDHGIAADCQKCPVALALFEQTRVPWNVSFESFKKGGGTIAYFGRLTIELPAVVGRWIYDFDSPETADGLRKPEPFSFDFNWSPA